MKERTILNPLRVVNTMTLEEIKEGQQGILIQERDVTKHGVVVRKIKNRERIVLNDKMGEKTIKIVHERFGHIGSSQMIALLTDQLYFRNMNRKIVEHCTKCEVCIKNKSRKSRDFEKMGQLGSAERLFQIMSLDTIGGFAGRRSTKRYLHLLVDHFTRFIYVLISKNQNASEFKTNRQSK